MSTLTIPDIETGASFLQVTDVNGKAMLEIRKLPKRVIIVAEVDGTELYKVKEDSNDAHVAIDDLKLKQVVETFRNGVWDEAISQNFTCFPSSIREKNGTHVPVIQGQQLKTTTYENHALLVAAKKLEHLPHSIHSGMKIAKHATLYVRSRYRRN